MNGSLAFLQQALAWLAGQARHAFGVLSAIAANRPAPARDVIVYALVTLAVLVFLAPKALKKFSK